MRYVKDVLVKNEIVFGVWQDSDEPNGFDMLVVKGNSVLRDVMAFDVTRIQVKTSAILCVEPEQAVALQQTHGDRSDVGVRP
jgi:hypothetical protein